MEKSTREENIGGAEEDCNNNKDGNSRSDNDSSTAGHKINNHIDHHKKSRHGKERRDYQDDRDGKEKSQRRSSSRSKKNKKKKRRHGRRENDYRSSEDDSSSSSSSSGSSDDSYSYSYSYDERSRRKRKHKKKKRQRRHSKHGRRRKHKRDQRGEESDAEDDNNNKSHSKQQQSDCFELADALLNLLTKHPAMAEDLPILLIRLCHRGTTFSLDSSSSSSSSSSLPVREPLERVLHCLKPYGVVALDNNGTWGWNSPVVGAAGRVSELALVRVVRTLLQDIGLDASIILDYEEKQQGNNSTAGAIAPASSKTNNNDIPVFVQRLLPTFPGLELELAGLCETILQGDSVSLEGLTNKELKESLSLLFQMCRLEQSEMEPDDEDDQEKNDDKQDEHQSATRPAATATATRTWMGFALPENSQADQNVAVGVVANIQYVIQACQDYKFKKTPRVVGPMPPPPDYKIPPAAPSSDDDYDEGPQLTPRDPKQIKAMAARRRLGAAAATAAAQSIRDGDHGGREEWMLVPGRVVFLDAVKSGRTIRNRQFQNIKSNDKNDRKESVIAVDPRIQAEMDHLRAAHQQARGPSLMQQHQAIKNAEQEQQKGNGKEWQWSRTKDLDTGRRVDKDALQMVLGGAADGLKSKFQGGFHSSR